MRSLCCVVLMIILCHFGTGMMEHEHFTNEPTQEQQYYLEETAYKYYQNSCKPLPPAPPVNLPKSSSLHCDYSFDEVSRVLLIKVRKDEGGDCYYNRLSKEDEQYVLRMMERDDVTCVFEGFCRNLDKNLWAFNRFSSPFGATAEPHYKVRVFRGVNNCTIVPQNYEEKDGVIVLTPSDFVRYLYQRKEELERIETTQKRNFKSELFSYCLYENGTRTRKIESLNCIDCVFYFIDYDLMKLMPHLHEDFEQHFLFPAILPAGRYCMMHNLAEESRPFMGPNLYMTPPASFTQFHQDGHGTVDSGHTCLSGYNEVVMLRRMPEVHKLRALDILTMHSTNKGSNKKNSPKKKYDALYGLPHGDGFTNRPDWPSCEVIYQWREMNYYPSVFILKPNQHVHINKGRLHAFRKMRCHALPQEDCHFTLRNSLKEEHPWGDNTEINCVSIAWDWMYRGVTSAGINREVAVMLECSASNRLNGTQALAIPELALLRNVGVLVSDLMAFDDDLEIDPAEDEMHNPCDEARDQRDREELLGYLPSLKYITGRHVKAAREHPSYDVKTSPCRFVDAMTHGDHLCIICKTELSNLFFKCVGCELYLSKEVRVFRKLIDMHSCVDSGSWTYVTHTQYFVLHYTALYTYM